MSTPKIPTKWKLVPVESTPVDEHGEPTWRMRAYYYSFCPTGVAAIDRILSAVACAGKSAHYTMDWTDDVGPYHDGLRGSSPIEWIQFAADDAAAVFTASPAPPEQAAQPADSTEERAIPLADGRKFVIACRGSSNSHFAIDELLAISARLIACWNACEGVSTDDLECNPALFRALKYERDELLAKVQPADVARKQPPFERLSYEAITAIPLYADWSDTRERIAYARRVAEVAMRSCEQQLRQRRLTTSQPAPSAEKQPADVARLVSTQAACDVLAERQRQTEGEGWTPERDDAHSGVGLDVAAVCYATAHEGDPVPAAWPWGDSWWKPKDRRSNLVKAAALLLAKIERLDRAALAAKGGE